MMRRVKYPLFVELFRYLSVGVVVVTIQFSLLSTLVELFHLNPTLASAISYVIATVVNYLLQYHFTFRSNHRHHVVFVRYLLVTGAALGLNVLIFWICNEVFQVWYLFSQMVALVLVTAFNFILGRYYTFG
jgi:putative flippase GtrA